FGIRFTFRQSDSANHREVLLFAPPPPAPRCATRTRRVVSPALIPDRRFARPLQRNLHGQTTSHRRPWRQSTRVRTHRPHPAEDGGLPALRILGLATHH